MSEWFSRKGRQPKCLSEVLPQLVKSRVLQDKADYLFHLKDQVTKQRSTWTSWSYQVLVSSPVKQLTKAVMSKVQGRSSQTAPCYIILENVNALAKTVLNKLHVEADVTGADSFLVFTYSEVKKKFRQVRETDLEILLLYMELEKLLCQTEHRGKTIFKFKSNKSPKGSVEPITDVEKGVLELRQSKNHLDSLLSSLNSQISNCAETIKQQLKLNNRSQALRQLRRKKLLEKKAKSAELHLSRVESILDEIHHADTNQMMLEAYSHGTAALKQINSVTPVQMVDEAMDELVSAVETRKEIAGALSDDRLSGDEGDGEQSLDAELEQLLKDDASIDDLLVNLEGLTVMKDTPSPNSEAARSAIKPPTAVTE